MNDFQEWLKTTPEYKTLIFQYGERLFIQRDGEFDCLPVRLAHRVWCEKQDRINEAITWLTRTDMRVINMAREILEGGDFKNLRGDHE